MDSRPDPALWRRAREVFDAVVSLAPLERAARLADLCRDAPDVRREVESLLAHHGSSDDLASVVENAAGEVVDDETRLHEGLRLLHYDLLARIGEGSMGTVWRATDRTLGRDVAIKVLPESLAADPTRVARFEQEAKTLASLNHPNVAAIYSLHHADSVRFLAMEYVDGDDLTLPIARGSMPLDRVVPIATQIATGLEEAHEKGIVHRDLKPANVKVRRDGTVKVLDFGLAKAFAGDPTVETRGVDDGVSAPSPAPGDTRVGAIVGTAAYMPPEQARGRPVDKRADIWAFGVIVFEMLSGQRPFAGATVTDVLSAVVAAEPDWSRLPADTPPPLVRLVRRCLEKDPRQRLRDIGDARLELEHLQPEVVSSSSSSAPWSRVLARRGLPAALAAVVALAVGAWAVWLPRAVPTARRGQSVAVLPLLDLSPEPREAYFADGVTEELLNTLARNPNLRVAARTSAFRFKSASEDLRTIGQALNVSALLEGSVTRTGNRVRLTARLVNADDGFQLWSNAYDRAVDDILAVQADIARAVADAMHVAPSGDAPPAGSPRVRSSAAYSAYLRGRYFDQRNTKDSLERAVASFETAIAQDPTFAPAWAGLSLARASIGTEGYAPPDTVFGEARRSAERAIALDPLLVDGHLALAMVQRVYDWDWASADATTQRALALEPNNAAIVLSSARGASTLGRVEEALALARRAVDLDPLNVQAIYRLGRYQLFLERFDEADATFQRVLALEPLYPAVHHDIAFALLGQGRVDAAMAALAKERQPLWRAFGTAVVEAARGRRQESDAALAMLVADFGDVAAYQIAQVHARRGDADKSLEWLERAYVLRDTGLSQLKPSREFRQLEHDPRFRAFLDKLRLP